MPSRLLALPLALVVLCICGCGTTSSPPPPPPPTNPIPVVSFVSPSTLALNTPLTITIFGSQFVSGAQVLLGPTPLTATFVDASHLKCDQSRLSRDKSLGDHAVAPRFSQDEKAGQWPTL